MPGYINTSGNYSFDGFGIVHVNVRSGIRSLTARWKNGMLYISARPGVEYDAVLGFLQQFSDRIRQMRPDTPYSQDRTIDFGDFSVQIKAQQHVTDKIFAHFDGNKGCIEIGTDWDRESPDTIKTVNRFVCRMAQSIAPGVLIPRAREIASEVGRRPLQWTISNGHRVLGHCSSKGVIALSYALLFYPRHLRDYVICHELAHLSEMNHSPRFHEICDLYCHGQEKRLEAELRAFKCDILR